MPPSSDEVVVPFEGAELIAQGAEGRLWSTIFIDRPAIVKERFRKRYRHPVLDEKLTKERLLAEARCIARARRAGVDAPVLYSVEIPRSLIVMERVHGVTVKAWLNAACSELGIPTVESRDLSLVASHDAIDDEESDSAIDEDVEMNDVPHEQLVKELVPCAVGIGKAIVSLHVMGMVHGDLTTSNMMVRNVEHSDRGIPVGNVLSQSSDISIMNITLIDFGLSSLHATHEEKAVDLYVLERALLSTHAGIAAPFFEKILESYFSEYQKRGELQVSLADSFLSPKGNLLKDVESIRGKYKQVRARGRKRLAFG